MNKFNKFTQEQKNGVLNTLNNEKRNYELDGIEISEEDAIDVLELMENGITMEDAVDKILCGIYDVLN